MKKGDIIQIEVEKYAFEGKGIGKIDIDNPSEISEPDSFIVFVNGAYPGDTVSAKIKKLKKSYAEAKVEEVITPSLQRVEPRCKFFGTCGGCKQQDLNYAQQIAYKQEQVEDIFKHDGGFTDLPARQSPETQTESTTGKAGFEIENILPSENIFYYRNKMEFSFSEVQWLTVISDENISNKGFFVGLHVPNNFEKILDIDECFLQSELSSHILNYSREFFKKRHPSIYNTKTHSGYLRNLIIRQAQKTKDVMLNLVTFEENELLMKEYVSAITSKFPEITTIINNISKKKASIAVGDYEIVYHGSGFIYDKIGDYKFRISANSFFQTNTIQAEKLYNTALSMPN